MAEQFFEHTIAIEAIGDACEQIRIRLAEVQAELDQLAAYKIQAETTIAELEDTVANQRAVIDQRDASILEMGQRFAEVQSALTSANTTISAQALTITTLEARANDAIGTLQGQNDGDLDL